MTFLIGLGLWALSCVASFLFGAWIYRKNAKKLEDKIALLEAAIDLKK